MKIKLLYLFTVIMALSSCHKEMETDYPYCYLGNTIQFGSPSIMHDVEITSRATGPVDAFSAGDSFGVLGYCLANYDGTNELNPTTGSTPWASKAVLCTPHIFYKTEIKYNGTTCYYTGEQKQWYDPSNYLYTFLAYHPYGDAYYTIEPETQAGIGFPSLTFSMPFSGGDISTPRQIDDIPDAMAAAAIDVTRQTGRVDLQFQHLLTGLNFRINNYNPTNNLIIHGLRVSGSFYRSIRILMSRGLEYPAETYAGTFSFLEVSDDSDDVVIESHKTEERTGNKTLLLISNLEASPDYLGNNINIHIDYTFMGVRTTDKIITLPSGYLPQGGTIYTIEMNFIGDSFILNFVADNNQTWEDGGDSSIKFE